MDDDRQQINKQLNPLTMYYRHIDYDDKRNCYTISQHLLQRCWRRGVKARVGLLIITIILSSYINYTVAFTPLFTLTQLNPLPEKFPNKITNNLYSSRLVQMSASTMIIPGGDSGTIGKSNSDELLDGGLTFNLDDDGQEQAKIGVLLLNLGGPEKSEDVEGFLYNLFADPDIIRLPGPLAPLQTLIALFISKRRAPKSRAAYESIGGGSPILRYSKSQGNLVSKSLHERYNIKAKTYIGMRYWYPFTEEALSEIQKDKIEALVIIPLYPQFSISTSGSSLRVLQEEFARRSDIWGPIAHTVVPQWYDRPGYVRAMADLILIELESFTESELKDGSAAAPTLPPRHVLFSAHGVPQSYIEAGDPYQSQIGECVDAISRLVLNKWGKEEVQIHLSYQSRVGPIEWLRPYTDDVLPELGAKGVKNLVVVPISFVSEHIETLEEIDMEYRELAEENGIDHWRRCPALNTDAAFIDDMADMVVEALNEPSQSVTEVCVANNVELVEDLDAGEGVISSAGVGGVGAGDVLVGKTKMRLGDGERINGRIAILGVVGSIVVELMSGKPLTQLFNWV